jgi:hypothetical protein
MKNILLVSVISIAAPKLLFAMEINSKFNCTIKNNQQFNSLQLNLVSNEAQTPIGFKMRFEQNNGPAIEASVSMDQKMRRHKVIKWKIDQYNTQQLAIFQQRLSDFEETSFVDPKHVGLPPVLAKKQVYPAVPTYKAQFNYFSPERGQPRSILAMEVDGHLLTTSEVKVNGRFETVAGLGCLQTPNKVPNEGETKTSSIAYQSQQSSNKIKRVEITREMWCLSDDLLGKIDLSKIELDPILVPNPDYENEYLEVDQEFLKSEYAVSCKFVGQEKL